MASDVVIKNGDGEEVTHEDVYGVELDTPDGGTATFLSEEDIPKELPEVTDEDEKKVLAVVSGAWQKASAESVINKGRLVPFPSSDSDGKVLGVVAGSWKETKLPRTWDELGGKPFGKTNTIIEEQEITLDISGSAYWCQVYDVGYPTVGDNYKVVWDGAEYTCTAKSLKEAMPNIDVGDNPFIGNLYTLFGEGYLDTGEPFFCVFQSDGHCEFLSRDSVGTESKTITVSVVPVVSFKKIPEEYLPELSGGGATTVVEKTVSYDFAVQGVPSVTTSIEALGLNLYKISDETPTIEELSGAKFSSDFHFAEGYGVSVNIITSTAQMANADIFVSDTYVNGNAQYVLIVCYKPGVIPATISGYDIDVNIPEPGIYVPFNDYTALPSAWKISLVYNQRVVSSLPLVTEADNGKVLGVVGGKWQATDAPGGAMVDVEKTAFYDFAVQGVPSVSVPNEVFGVTMYKVSDEMPSIEELQGATFVSNYAPGTFEGVNVEIDTSTALISTADLFMTDQYSDSDGAYNFAIVYKSGEISFEFMGMTVSINVPETGIYVPYDLGADPPANWQFSLTYKTKAVASGGTSSPPEFDLAAMGLPALSMTQMEQYLRCDATELCAALEKDVVKISFKIDLGMEITVTGIVNAMVLDGMYSCGFVGMFQGMPLLINFMIDTESIAASITILGTGSI